MRRTVAALAALAAFAHAGGAVAFDTIPLLSGATPVTPPPPVGTSASSLQSSTELEIPGHVSSREFVEVGIAPDGTLVRVTATQRLLVEGTGDYSFGVPAPATSIAAGPGSESQPGLRDVGILWQGFSNRRRVLSARVALRLKQAAAGLPLQVRIERQGGSTVVRLVDIARKEVTMTVGRAKRRAIVAVLQKIRAWYAHPTPGGSPGWFVHGTPANQTQRLEVSAPLHVTGVISEGPPRVTVDAVLGGRGPLVRSFEIPGTNTKTLRLRVSMPAPLEILPTPGEVRHAADPLTAVQQGLGGLATSASYQRYLTSPDPAAPSVDASFLYRSVPKPAAAAGPAGHGGGDTLAILLGALLGLAFLAGLAVLWARS